MMHKKTLLYIGGPTASGKTKVAIKLAKQYNTEIISCDSRQFYKEMKIGTSVPSAKERKGIIHHFLQHKSIFENYNAGDFEKDAVALLEKLFKNRDLIIMAGGSGLYAKSVLEGLDYFPEIPIKIRNQIEKMYKEKGLKHLQETLAIVDPLYYKQVDLNNSRRLIRALEVFRATKKPYSSFRKGNINSRPFKTEAFIIDVPKEVLHERITSRIDLMINRGLEQEALGLYKHRKINALQTIGYKEWFDLFENKLTQEEVKKEIVKNTNKYAKKQLTWFRKNFKKKFISEGEINLLLNDLL